MNVAVLNQSRARYAPAKSSAVSPWGPLLTTVVGGGIVALVFYFKNREGLQKIVEEASEAQPPGTLSREVTLRLTKYHPYAAVTEAEKKMEGGTNAAALWRGKKAIDPTTGKRPIVYTLEQFLAGKAPYVTLSGDPEIWPFGQRLVLEPWPNVVFRVTDTGGNFKGAKKVVRVIGDEPIDVAVDSPKSEVPSSARAKVVSNDNFVTGVIAFDRMGKPPTKPLAVAWDEGLNTDIVDAYTEVDVDAVARAISSISKCDEDAAKAVAWVCRNRASRLGVSPSDILAPGGKFGPASAERFASTRKPATPSARKIAEMVLEADPASDLTNGSVDFWLPDHQAICKAMGDLYRLAEESGDHRGMVEYAPFRNYAQTESDVRAWQRKQGLVPSGRFGQVETLRLMEQAS